MSGAAVIEKKKKKKVKKRIQSARVLSARYFGDISTPQANRKSLPGVGFISEVNAADPGAAQPPSLPERKSKHAASGGVYRRSQAGD